MNYVLFIALFICVLTGIYIIPKIVTWSQNPKYFFTIWKIEMKFLPRKIKRRIWNKHIILWWYQLWIRKGEFHKSLDMDRATMVEMNKKELEIYWKNLVKRRERYRDKK
ncbi:MAG TPA: hypothetical protein ENI76_10485 [Ignavibacteria bacterium]|mgnify:CR=1 FL=1|nr:hypothetical protein [Ignavibacteria bacterium]